MTQERTTSQSTSIRFANSYYAILGLHPSASVKEIRHAYRELSKRYHPDTTLLPIPVATAKFQQLNEAYGTLSNPEKRSLYDLKIGYSRWNVIQPLPELRQSAHHQAYHTMYLDQSDRPLSSGEVFALFLLAITLIGCLLLAVTIALLRTEEAIPVSPISPVSPEQVIIIQKSDYDLND